MCAYQPAVPWVEESKDWNQEFQEVHVLSWGQSKACRVYERRPSQRAKRGLESGAGKAMRGMVWSEWLRSTTFCGRSYCEVAWRRVGQNAYLHFPLRGVQCLTWKLSCMQHRHALHGSPFCIKGKSCAFRCSLWFLELRVVIQFNLDSEPGTVKENWVIHFTKGLIQKAFTKGRMASGTKDFFKSECECVSSFRHHVAVFRLRSNFEFQLQAVSRPKTNGCWWWSRWVRLSLPENGVPMYCWPIFYLMKPIPYMHGGYGKYHNICSRQISRCCESSRSVHVKFNSKLGGQRVEVHMTKGVVVGGIFRYAWKIYEHLHLERAQRKHTTKNTEETWNQVIPAVTFLVPKRWRSPTFEFGLRLHHTKKVTIAELPGCGHSQKVAICKEPWQTNTWQLRHLSRCYIYMYLPWVSASWFMIGPQKQQISSKCQFFMFLNVLLSIQSRNNAWDTVYGTCLSIGPDRTFSIHLSWLKIGPLIGLVESQPRSLTVDSCKSYLFPPKKKREQLKLVLVTSFVQGQISLLKL